MQEDFIYCPQCGKKVENTFKVTAKAKESVFKTEEFGGELIITQYIGFDDPSRLSGDANFIMTEFRRVRDEIKNAFARFYLTEIKKAELPHCVCE